MADSASLPDVGANPTDPAVSLRGVTKIYDSGVAALGPLDLEVRRGEFVSLLGPSGCGKSTALRLISGLNAPTSGTVEISHGAGEMRAGHSIGFVFQEPTLLPWLTVARNIEVPQRLRRVPAPERAATRNRVLELVRLADKAGAYPRQLSGGQKMRVSLARALAVSPKILLLDEPFGALDEMTREHLNEELLAIREQQAWTAFFVTHSVAEAVFLSDRIFVLAANPGRVHAEIAVPLPRPRTAETRESAAFEEAVTRTSRLLRGVQHA